jgi:hypothetical protein
MGVLVLSPISLAIAFGAFDGWASVIFGTLSICATLGIIGRRFYLSLRAAKAHRTLQADERGIMVSYVGDKGPAFRTIDRSEIRNVWVRRPFLDRTWSLLVFTRGRNYSMDFASPACSIVLEMEWKLRYAMNLPQEQRRIPFHFLTTPLDR